jgi:hypothetical protein
MLPRRDSAVAGPEVYPARSVRCACASLDSYSRKRQAPASIQRPRRRRGPSSPLEKPRLPVPSPKPHPPWPPSPAAYVRGTGTSSSALMSGGSSGQVRTIQRLSHGRWLDLEAERRGEFRAPFTHSRRRESEGSRRPSRSLSPRLLFRGSNPSQLSHLVISVARRRKSGSELICRCKRRTLLRSRARGDVVGPSPRALEPAALKARAVPGQARSRGDYPGATSAREGARCRLLRSLPGHSMSHH